MYPKIRFFHQFNGYFYPFLPWNLSNTDQILHAHCTARKLALIKEFKCFWHTSQHRKFRRFIWHPRLQKDLAIFSTRIPVLSSSSSHLNKVSQNSMNIVLSSSISYTHLHFFTQTLTTLDLSSNQIGAVGAQDVADALTKNTVTILLSSSTSYTHLHFFT